MGVGGISVWQLLIILVIVLLLFGTKRLKNIGSDLGGAVKGFKKSMSDSEKTEEEARIAQIDEKVVGDNSSTQEQQKQNPDQNNKQS